MHYEEYFNGKGWGVRSITDKSGTKYEEKHVIYFGEGQNNWLKAKAKASYLNSQEANPQQRADKE